MAIFKDKEGKDKFSMNPQVGRAMHGGHKGGESPKHHGEEHKPEHEGHEGHGSSVTLHDHGDGTYHTEHEGGERVEHPHLGHALVHIAHHHEPTGKHSHIHHHAEGGHTSHHVDEQGNIEGPHDHENLEALKSHMDQFLNEEGQEGSQYGGGEHEMASSTDGGDSSGIGHLLA